MSVGQLVECRGTFGFGDPSCARGWNAFSEVKVLSSVAGVVLLIKVLINTK